jgi:pimeloyl-ACP methyl ester carboxylesterase
VTVVHANGIAQHVQQMGEPGAPTVVCVHGLGTDSLASWYFTLGKPLADAGHRVVMYDLRGHGRTERPPTGYTLDDFVSDVAALLDALDVTGPVYLVGNSFGGTIAFGLAVRHPERVAGITVIESEPATAGWAAKMAANLVEAGTQLRRPEALAWVAARYGRHTAKLARSAAALLHATTLAEDIPAGAVPSAAQVAAIDCPVLAVYGEDSDLADQAPLLRAWLPRCATALVPRQEHSVLVETPGAVRDLVLPWLRRCTSEVPA